MRRIALLFALLLVGAIAASCSDNNGVDPGPTLAGPFPTFPYSFSGRLTVGGAPAPEGTLVFARMGGTHSDPAATPRDGFYQNVIIGPGPERTEDLYERVRFYIGTLDGPSVEAEETFEFKVVSAPTAVELDLTFPRLP